MWMEPVLEPLWLWAQRDPRLCRLGTQVSRPCHLLAGPPISQQLTAFGCVALGVFMDP